MRRRPQFPHRIILPEGFYACSQSHPVLQTNVRVALKHPHRQTCTHKLRQECLCDSYCWLQCRHSWEGCVQCSQQQSWPFALDFLSSSVLQKEKKKKKKKKTGTYLGDTSGFGFLGSRTPHLNLSPLKPRNKTPSDMHVGWSIFWSTNLHPSCPTEDTLPLCVWLTCSQL